MKMTAEEYRKPAKPKILEKHVQSEITLTISGQLPRKSNSRRFVINRRTGKPMVIKSAEALRYEADFLRQVTGPQRLGLSGNLSLTAIIYYRSNRSDLSDELLCDLLEKAGVIENDRCIVEKRLTKRIDKDSPRVEVRIEELEERMEG